MHTRLPGPRAIAAAAIAGLLFGAIVAAPAAAITRGGTLDGNDHPMVGLLTVHAEGGEYLWRCSGTLISPTVFITAGHCTEPDDSQGFGLPAYGLIYFSDELIEPDPDFTLTTRSCDGIEGYPCGDAGGELVTRTGSLYLHPEYDPNAFYTHDLGVVVLDQPLNLPEYAQLPELNSLDELKLGARFDSVGFGLQRAHGPGASWRDIANRVRMVAHPYLIQLNIGRPLIRDFAMLLSNNPTTGGTCFGDSGGSDFLGGTNIILAVNSYVTNGNCAGVTYSNRIDSEEALDFIRSF